MARRRMVGRRKGKDKRKGVVRVSYNIPDEIDLDLHQKEFEKLSKNLDEQGKAKPITDSNLKALIRSAIREKWMYCNTKLAFINSKVVPDLDTTSRRRFKVQCNICKGWFSKSAVDVDHRKGENSFTELQQALEWSGSILDVGFDDLQILCSEGCHPIKTLSESHDISFEEAVILKKVIAWEKDKSQNHKEFLINKGFKEDEVSNGTKRRECYIKFLNNLEENNG